MHIDSEHTIYINGGPELQFKKKFIFKFYVLRCNPHISLYVYKFVRIT